MENQPYFVVVNMALLIVIEFYATPSSTSGHTQPSHSNVHVWLRMGVMNMVNSKGRLLCSEKTCTMCLAKLSILDVCMRHWLFSSELIYNAYTVVSQKIAHSRKSAYLLLFAQYPV